MIHPLSTPCSLIHRGTLSSKDAAQITCVRPNRIKTEPWACGATPGSIFTSRRSEAPLPSRRSMEPGRLGPLREGCKHLSQLLVQIGRILLSRSRSCVRTPPESTRLVERKWPGRRDYPDYPFRPSGSAIRLAPALFRAPRVAVELRSNLAGWIQLGKWNGRAGEIRTRGLLVPNEALCQAEPRPDKLTTNNLREFLTPQTRTCTPFLHAIP